LNVLSRPFTLSQEDFPKELAAFVGFIGGEYLDSTLSRVILKLASYSPQVRAFFGDRYFFQEQWPNFIEQQFKLDVADPLQIRSAFLIAGINRVRAKLSQTALDRFRAAIIDALSPDRDMRQLEHEIRCYAHFSLKGFEVRLADLEGVGRYDLLLANSAIQAEVECKTVAEDTGLQLKRQMSADLFEAFRRSSSAQPVANASGIFKLTLNKPADQCANLARAAEKALRGYRGGLALQKDFSLIFEPRPTWQSFLETHQIETLKKAIEDDPVWAGSDYIAFQQKRAVVAFSVRPHRQGQLRQRLTRVLKDAADQCTGTRAAVLWLHFVGATERDFLELAQFSMSNRRAGLNWVADNVVRPTGPVDNRSHIHMIRYSAGAQIITNKPALAPNLLLARAASLDSKSYDVLNLHCKYTSKVEF
jgi:hypothetical protein